MQSWTPHRKVFRNFTFLLILHQTMTLFPYQEGLHIFSGHLGSKLLHFLKDRQEIKRLLLSLLHKSSSFHVTIINCVYELLDELLWFLHFFRSRTFPWFNKNTVNLIFLLTFHSKNFKLIKKDRINKIMTETKKIFDKTKTTNFDSRYTTSLSWVQSTNDDNPETLINSNTQYKKIYLQFLKNNTKIKGVVELTK